MATVGTLTSLQAAAALSLFKGYGLGVNPDFNSNVIVYSTTGLSALGGTTAFIVSQGSSNVNVANAVSFYTGRFGTYYSGSQTLGANTIPAITQTMPGSITTFTGNGAGNVVYQIDKACSRVVGSDASFDLGYFINTFTLASGYVTMSNRYLNASNVSSNTAFTSYGVTNYQGMVTQGWDKYQIGTALVSAFNNIGVMTDSIRLNAFGTAGGVATVLINNGLSDVGNLSANLTAANVNLNDLTNERYDSAITYVLQNITNKDQLTTIQETIGSNVPNMTSLLDYTSISACAGRSNDSVFESFANVGADLYKKSNTPGFRSGADVATLISVIQNPNDSAIESLSGNGNLLNSTITSELATYLPSSPTNTTITMLDVIGSPSGYYDNALSNVINGLSQLNSTSYGPQIVTALNDIITTATDFDAVNLAPYYGSVPDAVNAYNSLLTTIVNDPKVYPIVNQINTNYSTICQSTVTEYQNWTKAKFYTGSFGDSMTIMSFAQSLPTLAQDVQKTGSGQMIAGMIQNDIHGSTIRAALIEGKNYQRLQTFGVPPNGYVAT